MNKLATIKEDKPMVSISQEASGNNASFVGANNIEEEVDDEIEEEELEEEEIDEDDDDIEEDIDEEEDDMDSIEEPKDVRRKIPIKYIENRTRRQVTFAKRRHGIMKKAYELSVLTGSNILLLILSNNGLIYTFTTPKLEPIIRENEGKELIRSCLNN